MIRRVKPSDFRAIYDINQICHKESEPNIFLLEKLKNFVTFVAEEDDKVVGFLISRLKERGPNIYNVAVLPEYRGKGLATALFKECEQFYRGNLCMYLHVDVSNPAQKLYFDLGYRATSIKENFYGRGAHAIRMEKVLGA